MHPILHLSLPVTDLGAARAFYVDQLGCGAGRVRDGWLDVWFYGMQVTLQERPDEALDHTAVGVRHFGVTLDGDDLREVVERVNRAGLACALVTDFAGTAEEQSKVKIRDPSGNVIEFKSYAHRAALERP